MCQYEEYKMKQPFSDGGVGGGVGNASLCCVLTKGGFSQTFPEELRLT